MILTTRGARTLPTKNHSELRGPVGPLRSMSEDAGIRTRAPSAHMAEVASFKSHAPTNSKQDKRLFFG